MAELLRQELPTPRKVREYLSISGLIPFTCRCS
nr:MAG TPA: Periviscerokinin family [Caudoviricetes sp.]